MRCPVLQLEDVSRLIKTLLLIFPQCLQLQRKIENFLKMYLVAQIKRIGAYSFT
jgi:hypothetical protein